LLRPSCTSSARASTAARSTRRTEVSSLCSAGWLCLRRCIKQKCHHHRRMIRRITALLGLGLHDPRQIEVLANRIAHKMRHMPGRAAGPKYAEQRLRRGVATRPSLFASVASISRQPPTPGGEPDQLRSPHGTSPRGPLLAAGLVGLRHFAGAAWVCVIPAMAASTRSISATGGIGKLCHQRPV
jgi:hypothetical protein